MTAIAITAKNADDKEQLTAVMKALIEVANNITDLERAMKDGHRQGEAVDVRPPFEIMDEEDFGLDRLETIVSEMEVVEPYQHEDWEPGEPCPECGSEDITVMSPREYHIETLDGDVVHGAPDDMTGPDLDHWCQGCDTLLSEHPASALFNVF